MNCKKSKASDRPIHLDVVAKIHPTLRYETISALSWIPKSIIVTQISNKLCFLKPLFTCKQTTVTAKALCDISLVYISVYAWLY